MNANEREQDKNRELNLKIERLRRRLSHCDFCPRECGADRNAGETGQCGAGRDIAISGYGPHFGEEPPLVGRGGSGTIFFAYCSLRCVFCQNFLTSRGREAFPITIDELAAIMIRLQDTGCININLVSPTHYAAQIAEAWAKALSLGLHLPVVYNTSGYEKVDVLRELEGIVDIYMPDLKYADAEAARRYSGVENYPETAKEAVKEMHRQVGDLQLNERGEAVRGLLIRHLVMPGGLAGTAELMEFIAREVSPRSWINIMDQYYPAYHARRYPEISRRISRQEFQEALAAARRASPYFHLL